MSGSAFPGLKVGPLDPDRTAEFGQISGTNRARELLRHHAAAHPPDLRSALAKKLDEARTKALDLDEIRDAIEVEDDHRIVGASVRGERDTEQVLTYTVQTPSGRTIKWFAPYTADDFPDSVEAGDELVRIDELKKAGLPWDAKSGPRDLHAGGADNESLRRQVGRLNARIGELEQQLGSGGTPAAAVEDEEPTEEPWDGYDEASANEIVDRLESEETTDEERDAALAYEQSLARPRKTILRALGVETD